MPCIRSLNTGEAATASLRSNGSAFHGFALLPEVDPRAVLAEDESLALADDIFVLRSQGDVAAAASSILDRDDDAVFFVV